MWGKFAVVQSHAPTLPPTTPRSSAMPPNGGHAPLNAPGRAVESARRYMPFACAISPGADDRTIA